MKIPFKCNKVKLTSKFGPRTLNGKTGNHKGYDLVGVGAYEVCAVEGGFVIQSRIVTDKSNGLWERGNYICIRTDSGNIHYYCHLKNRAVQKGQRVETGAKLGIMGNTGYSFGAHLHFEVRKSDDKTVISPEGVLGIPNKTGTYEAEEKPSIERDIEVLVKKKIITTPEYWINTAKTVRYLPELLHNMAEELR